MAFFRKLFQGGGKNKKTDYPNVIQGVDPMESWVKVGELGDGAFGKVFKMEQRESGKLAAMKRVPIRDEFELDDFMVEIDILAENKHPNIVGLYEAFFYDATLWIYIEFCAGGAVDDIIVELDHGLSEQQIRCISHQLFEALNFLHSVYCIHRDLKAGNILLCPDGSIRLADFGVSSKDNAKGKQKHDTFIGTPYWMAPEVVLCETIKDDPYNSSADIWSVGITLIELADMNPPYHEMSPMRVLQKIIKKEPPTLAVPSQWSKDFNNLVGKCLNKQASARPSAQELLEHAFVADVSDYKPLRVLYQEVKCDVEEIVEELPEDADLTTDVSQSSNISLPSTPTSTPDSITRLDTSIETAPHEAMASSSDRTPSVDRDSLVVPNSDSGPVLVPSAPHKEGKDASPASASDTMTSGSELSATPMPMQLNSEERESTPGVRTVGVTKEGQGATAVDNRGGRGGKSGPNSQDYRYATLSRVRKFKVDGKDVESVTKKIVDVTSNRTLRDSKKYQQMRKQDFRELKQLQRDEMKEATEYFVKIKSDREVQDKKFEGEVQELEKHYEVELEAIKKRQKKETERLESLHVQQFKSKFKSVKKQQGKDLKQFKDNLKEEEKLEVKRVEASSTKAERKIAVNQVKLDLQTRRPEKEETFTRKQAEEFESEIKHILKEQKEEKKTFEFSSMDTRHNLQRNHMSMLWEMEQRQKQENYQLLKQQVREAFHMQRHQIQVRHQMEVDLQGRRDHFHLEELRLQQLLEKRQLPKILKLEHKQKVTEVRKNLRNKKSSDKDSLRKLDKEYVQKCQLETELMNEKHEKTMETLRVELDTNMRELQEIQNEKKMLLTQQETNKMKDKDDQHILEMKKWKADIAERKQKLEDDFCASRDEQEQLYSLDKPLPKQLRLSLFLPGAVRRVDSRGDSISSACMDSPTSSLSMMSVTDSLPLSRAPLQPLDEVVLGTPLLDRSSPPDKDTPALDATA